MDTPTHSFIYPDRPIYRAASQYNQIYPYSNAFMDALLTPGNRQTRFNAGSDSLAYWVGYQQMMKLYRKFLDRMVAKHPALAEQMNRHPILVGLPLALIGVPASVLTGYLYQGGWRKLRQWPPIAGLIERGLYSKGGNVAARLLQPVARFVNKPWVLGTLAVAGLGFALTLIFRVFQDRFNFGRAYRAVRQAEQQPNYTGQIASPYELQRRIAQFQQARLTRQIPKNLTAPVYNQMFLNG